MPPTGPAAPTGSRRGAPATGRTSGARRAAGAGRAQGAVSRAGFPLAEDAARRPKALILDFFGAYVRDIGGWIKVSDLVRLMGTLSVDEASVRAASARMISSGLLARETRGTSRGYRLTEESLNALREADRRILAQQGPTEPTEGWVLVSFSLPESRRSERHLLRSRLIWLGFGNISGGLWIAPARLQRELEATVRSLGLTEYVHHFTAAYRGFGQLADMVAGAWDLGELRSLYAEFLAARRPVLERWLGAAVPSDAEAFQDFTIALYHWRRFPYLDPGLPVEVLPDGWEGQEARELFMQLRDALHWRALRHVRTVTGELGPS